VIGVSAQHAVLGHERFALGSYPPDPGLLTLRAVARGADQQGL